MSARRPKSRIRRLRHEAWVRQGGRCLWCDRAVPESHATADHVRDHSKGGASDEDNIVMSCWDCNQARARANDYGLSECLT